MDYTRLSVVTPFPINAEVIRDHEKRSRFCDHIVTNRDQSPVFAYTQGSTLLTRKLVLK
jgi:hypothetical protein